MSEPRRKTFLENPASHGEDDPVQLMVTIGGRAVARFDMFLGEITAGGETATVMWGSDLFVDPDFRKRGLGSLVSKGLQDVHPVAAVCGVSARSRPIFWKLEWTDFQMPRHLALRHSRPIVDRYLRFRPAAAAASGVVDAGLALHRVMLNARARRRRSGLSVERVEEMPAQIDELLSPRDDRVTPHRSTRWINWLKTNRFEGDANQRKELYLVEDGGTPVAYFLTKSRFYAEASQYQIENVTIGSLLDWRVFDERRLDTFDVSLLALEMLAATEVDVVEICMPDPAVSRKLARLGLPTAGSLNLMFKAAPGSLLHPPDYHHPERWLMRPADGDNSFT
jgi:GNAT superfamily N-acetyltransferase